MIHAFSREENLNSYEYERIGKTCDVKRRYHRRASMVVSAVMGSLLLTTKLAEFYRKSSQES